MNLFQKLWGHILYGTACVVNAVFVVLIAIVDLLVDVAKTVGKGVLILLTSGGCLIFLLLGPALFAFLPFLFPIFLIMIAILLLGNKLLSMLKYGQYAVVEYLHDRATYYKTGQRPGYDNVGDYGKRYTRMEEEARRKAEEAYRRAQEEARRAQTQHWEEEFRRWFEYQRQQQQNYGQGYGGQRSQGYYGGAGGQTYQDPTTSFVQEYEEACQLLGISPDTDEYQVKLAYRKKAKEYHPDLNREQGAEDMFKKINNAYQLLTPENIARYKRIKGL